MPNTSSVVPFPGSSHFIPPSLLGDIPRRHSTQPSSPPRTSLFSISIVARVEIQHKLSLLSLRLSAILDPKKERLLLSSNPHKCLSQAGQRTWFCAHAHRFAGFTIQLPAVTRAMACGSLALLATITFEIREELKLWYPVCPSTPLRLTYVLQNSMPCVQRLNGSLPSPLLLRQGHWNSSTIQ